MKDVVVIGAGPAGLHAAHQLATSGLDVALLESRGAIGDGAICSGVIGEEAFAKFELPTSAVRTELRWIQAISPRGKKLDHKTDSPLARVVDKTAFNCALGDRAASAGVDIRLGHFVDFVQHWKDSVVLGVRAADDVRLNMRARMAVIASGVNGSLNRMLGLTRPRQLLRAMQTDLALNDGDPTGPTRIYVGRAVAPGAFGWKIPMGGGRARVGVMTTADPKPYFKNLVRRVAPECDQTQLAPSQKAIAQAPIGNCIAERIMAIGEAAGHVKTSTGGGIYYGLMSAEFAARVIQRAFRKGDFSLQVLSDFDRYWRTAFGDELSVGFFARELAARLPDVLIEKLFTSVSASNFIVRLDGKLKFDWHHRALLTALRHWVLAPGRSKAQ